MKLPIFETARLILREVALEDLDSYNLHFNNYEIIRNLSAHFSWPYPEAETQRFLEQVYFPEAGKTKWLWGLFKKEKPMELIGCVFLQREGNPENRGFWLAQKFWGQGLMTEALQPITDFAFRSLKFKKLILANASENHGSRRIKEKEGARFLRIQPHRFVDPTFLNLEVWELTFEDWEKLRGK